MTVVGWTVVACVCLAFSLALVYSLGVEAERGNEVDAMAEVYGLKRRADETDPELTARILEQAQAEYEERE